MPTAYGCRTCTTALRGIALRESRQPLDPPAGVHPASPVLSGGAALLIESLSQPWLGGRDTVVLEVLLEVTGLVHL